MTESFFGGLICKDSIVDVNRLQCNNQLCINGPWSERQRVDRIDTTRLALLSSYATAVISIDGYLLLSGCPLLAEAPLALGSGAGLRWRRKLASDEVADEYTVLPSCMHFGGTSATLSLTRDPIFFLADPSNQSPAFSATHPGHWDKLRGGHELVSFLHSVVDCSNIARYNIISQPLLTRLKSIGSAYSGDTTRGCTTSEEALQLW